MPGATGTFREVDVIVEPGDVLVIDVPDKGLPFTVAESGECEAHSFIYPVIITGANRPQGTDLYRYVASTGSIHSIDAEDRILALWDRNSALARYHLNSSDIGAGQGCSRQVANSEDDDAYHLAIGTAKGGAVVLDWAPIVEAKPNSAGSPVEPAVSSSACLTAIDKGGSHFWTVPAGVTSIVFSGWSGGDAVTESLWCADHGLTASSLRGRSSRCSVTSVLCIAGAAPSFVNSEHAVIPGETLLVKVGTRGTPSYGCIDSAVYDACPTLPHGPAEEATIGGATAIYRSVPATKGSISWLLLASTTLMNTTKANSTLSADRPNLVMTIPRAQQCTSVSHWLLDAGTVDPQVVAGASDGMAVLAWCDMRGAISESLSASEAEKVGTHAPGAVDNVHLRLSPESGASTTE